MFIIGGSSGWRWISVYSKEMQATAFCDKLGNITCEVSHRKKEQRGKNLLAMASIAFFLALVWVMETIVPENSSLQRCKLLLFVVMGTFIALLYSRFFIAVWHGAEHMAITTYRQKRSTDMSDIENESPVSKTCGIRFLFPVYCFTVLSCILEILTGNLSTALISWLIFLVCFKLAPYRWIEVFCPLWFSIFVQRHFTAHKPDKQQLLTAQRAVEELIATSKVCAQ